MNASKKCDPRQIAKWREAGALSTPYDVGYSVSFCVSAMAQGKVDPKQVKLIVAGTAAKDSEGWDKVISEYRRYYWIDHEDVAEAIIRDFIRRGKVYQPRLDPTIGLAPRLGGRNLWGRISDPVTYMSRSAYDDDVKRPVYR